ncbi:MAG: sigma-70 family RNA polymerase sigma factor [Flavobacteriaceae bacterium]|nr:sigma-70 family RNA polymerase sigma factor [Flavobacteriaceae bacterium]
MEDKNQLVRIQIQNAKSGNQMAYSFLLDRFWNFVYGFQLKQTNNENDAEDIAIQTFSKAFDKINSFDEKYEFKTWLIAISKNVHIDLMRQRQKKILGDSNDGELLGILDDAPTAEDTLIREQNLAVLLAHIKKLKPHYQKVINLRYFNELSYQEIAAETGESLNNIKVKLLRAKKLLAEIIRKEPKS